MENNQISINALPIVPEAQINADTVIPIGAGGLKLGTIGKVLGVGRDVTHPINAQIEVAQRYHPNCTGFQKSGAVGNLMVKTGIPEGSDGIFIMEFTGVDYGSARIINFKISGYVVGLTGGNINASRGAVHQVDIIRHDKNSYPISIGITTDGFLAVVMGGNFLSVGFRVDYDAAWHGAPNTEKNWSVVEIPSTAGLFVDLHQLTPVTPA